MHQILEHSHLATCELHRYWLSGMQPDVFKECERDSKYSRLLSKLDHCLEIPYNAESCYLDWPYLQSPVPLDES